MREMEKERKIVRVEIERKREKKRSEGADNGSGQQNEYRHALFFPDV